MYPDALLDSFRQITDEPADRVIAKLFALKKNQILAQISQSIQYNQDIFNNNLPDFVQEYFQQHASLPAWADESKLQKGFDFFAQHTEPILSMLGFLSLPYCYAAEYGVQVLYLSQRIAQDTLRRLTETAQFVLDVNQPNAFSPQGKGIASSLKVRLIHAAIRYHLEKSKKWNTLWGKPINQEDMAGTNLAFSLITLRGLRKIGIAVSPQEAENYQHLWNVIGFFLGVNQELLPSDNRAAFWLDKRIAERHFRPSQAGRALTNSLLAVFENNPDSPFPKGFATSYMRFLLGKEIAQILDLPSSNWTATLIPTIFQTNWNQRFFPWFPNPLKNGQILRNLQKELQAQPVDFAIPKQLNKKELSKNLQNQSKSLTLQA
ncbi:MAG: DUF2236 domain-containing protein [Microscillaceae bacterium]|nr:DUF2236 domain-containing protein [Microscillaceae bacterium]MDW8459958.1 oxygenase MpaB family protein [Cytophagales bacterium]